MILLEGNVSVKAAILAKHRKVTKVYYDRDKHDKDFNFILHRAKENVIPCIPMDRSEIDKMAKGRTHGGLLAEATKRIYQSVDDCLQTGKPFLVLLEGVEDPFNLGYIMRTLYSAGCDGLILPQHDWQTAESTIVKSSAGAFEYLNIVMNEDLPILIRHLKKKQIRCFAAMRKDAVMYTEADYRHACMIAVGGEMRGLSSAVRKEIDQNIYIPYANDFHNALNAASAAAVLAFEVYRQRL